MFWWPMTKYFHSLAWRLTLWYAAIFTVCFAAVFGVFYILMQDHFHDWTDRQLKEEVQEVKMAYEEDGLQGVMKTFKLEEATDGDRFMGRIIGSGGGIVFESVPAAWERIRVNSDQVAKAGAGGEIVELLELDDSSAVRVIYSFLSDGAVVQIGLALLPHEIWMQKFAVSLFHVALLALGLSITAGGFMAGRALAPIRDIARTAASISGRSLGQRVPVSHGSDEVDQLIEAFNGMLVRIDTLVEGLRDVTDTLAHDLRTPIAGIRGLAEVTLRSPREPQVYRMTLYQIIELMDRILTQFNSILDVAEAESQTLALRHEPLALDELANDILQTFEPVAMDKGVVLESSLSSGLTVVGDRGRLTQVLANLIDNALKYTASGGHVRVSVEGDSEQDGVIVCIEDTGIGISPKDLPHIFERYYRGDLGRSGPGIGLGLPLVQSIVKAHGGSVDVKTQPGNGTMFRVFLPFDHKP